MTTIDEARAALLAAWHANASTIEVTELLDALIAAVRAEREGLVALPDWPTLANIIRTVDGKHDLGAGELAERILAALATPPAPENDRCAVCGHEPHGSLLGCTFESSVEPDWFCACQHQTAPESKP